MAHLTTTIPKLGREGYEWIESGLSDSGVPDQYTVVFGEISHEDQRNRDISLLSDLGYANEISEGSAVDIDSIYAPYNLVVPHIMHGLGFEISKQGRDRDLYRKVKDPLRRLGATIKETRNLSAANVLTLGFTDPSSGGTPTMDGEALFDSDHGIEGGTASNLAALALSASNLETARASFRKQVTHKGKPISAVGGVNLFVPPDLEHRALRIVGSTLQAETANNDKNVVGTGVTVQVMDYVTATAMLDAWWLVTKNKMKNPLRRMNGIPLHFEEEYTVATKMHLFTVGEEWADYAGDWRYTYGSNP